MVNNTYLSAQFYIRTAYPEENTTRRMEPYLIWLNEHNTQSGGDIRTEDGHICGKAHIMCRRTINVSCRLRCGISACVRNHSLLYPVLINLLQVLSWYLLAVLLSFSAPCDLFTAFATKMASLN
ncbi:hypothetical protein EB241_19290 [Erwinia psidii]|uniref:Uncharacterized protein n=1 Tax=Erwinia psidii TaxID=69224 RepID=A0A3N6RWJ1_9GAMM|nr:hypothetical protein EB241_19290 [Erwinia psidii]